MSELNQKIVMFIARESAQWETPSKIGNLFMNRFAIDEDAKNEILKIYHLECPKHPCHNEGIALRKGLDPINYEKTYDS